MNVEILLGIRSSPLEKLVIIKVKNVDISERTLLLRSEIADQTKYSKHSFDLIYGGTILDDETPLDAYGIKEGSLVHLIKKKEGEIKPPFNETEPNVQMMSVFRSLIGTPFLQGAMRNMSKNPDAIRNIVLASPGLKDDAVAVAFLHDPELISQFTNPETIRKIVKLHPTLLNAAQHIVNAVHDEAHNMISSSSSQNSSLNAATSDHNYHIDNLSDDEDMSSDVSASESLQPSALPPSNQADSLISTAQLMAAIAGARRSIPDRPPLPPSPSTLSRSNSNGGGIITYEMFNEAMQHAFAATPTANASTQHPALRIHTAPLTPPEMMDSNDTTTQISLMREVGLTNDAINLQALQVTNGDVQAAIDLVLNGFGEN